MLKKNSDVKLIFSDGTLTASVEGEIDHYGAASVRMKIDSELEKLLPETLILNLEGVKFMDSSGLGLILGRYNKATANKVAFKLKNPSDAVKKILSAVGADKFLKLEEIRSTEEEKL